MGFLELENATARLGPTSPPDPKVLRSLLTAAHRLVPGASGPDFAPGIVRNLTRPLVAMLTGQLR